MSTSFTATDAPIFWVATHDVKTKGYGICLPGESYESNCDLVTQHSTRQSWFAEMQFQGMLVTANDVLHSGSWFRWADASKAQAALDAIHGHPAAGGLLKWSAAPWVCADGKFGFPCLPTYLLEIIGIGTQGIEDPQDPWAAFAPSESAQWTAHYVTAAGGVEEPFDAKWAIPK